MKSGLEDVGQDGVRPDSARCLELRMLRARQWI